MGYEIDFMPVGKETKSGDAIALRYGSEGNYTIIVIDGGTKESGEALVEHIKYYYKTTYVDYVVNTHPDNDHSSGLSIVLENLTVGQLWIHRPWAHSSEIKEYLKDQRITEGSLERKLQESFQNAYALEVIAQEKGIPIYEPFQGEKIGDLIVLSPSYSLYQNLILQSDKTPDLKESNVVKTFFESAQKMVKEARNWVVAHWELDNLQEDVETSEINETSVVLFGNFDGKKILLTADVGIKGLNEAVSYSGNILLQDLEECIFYQIPHHGSRHNVSPSILNAVVGEIVETGTKPFKTAFVSVAKNSSTHPRKTVTNAFVRRGVRVIQTKGIKIWKYSSDMPTRSDYFDAIPLTFSEMEEE